MGAMTQVQGWSTSSTMSSTKKWSSGLTPACCVCFVEPGGTLKSSYLLCVSAQEITVSLLVTHFSSTERKHTHAHTDTNTHACARHDIVQGHEGWYSRRSLFCLFSAPFCLSLHTHTCTRALTRMHVPPVFEVRFR